MSEFRRWHSIENSYRQKHIDWWLEQYPQLEDETYVITEKLHGSNFQWYFQPGKPVMAGSRSNYLDTSGSFNGASISELMEKDDWVLHVMQHRVDVENCTTRLFGELFGKGIQKGVRYGDQKRVLYFAMVVNDVLLSFRELREALSDEFLVPTAATIEGLQAAIDNDTKFDSLYLGEPDNICEGVVIQPYSKVYLDGNGSPFILKKKNDEFKEKAKVKRVRIADPEVDRLKAEFASYVTDNRLQSVFSKHGEIKNPSQIGDYIHWMLADAREEFVKDFGDDFDVLDKAQGKQVCNVGSTIAHMLRDYL